MLNSPSKEGVVKQRSTSLSTSEDVYKRQGRVLFELEFSQRDVAIESLKLAAQKLPIKVKIIEKEAAEA